MARSDEEIYHEARQRAPGSARSAYLDSACGDDAELRALVEALLKADSEAGLFLVSVENAAPTSVATVARSSAIPQADAHSLQADAAPPSETPGTIIGRYKLLQRIGEGGFGTVWMAEQREPVIRKVALKIIKLGMDTRQVIARFEAERQALALMDHPNIAKVLDAGATDTGRPFFVMELCTGDSITEYCDRNNLTIRERLELIAEVCQAVQHAHQKGLIHRDIKPNNILVATQDGRPHAKVIDFGIAKATTSRLTEKTLFTEHKQLIGTPQYMSPEQAEGSLDIDTRTDVYSLGVLLYELLTGTTPFDPKKLRNAAFDEIQRIIREVEPPKPSTRLSQSTGTLATIAARRHIEPKKLGTIIRGELDWVVMRCLEKDRSRRYETANGLAADIRRYLAGEPVIAAPPGRTYLIRKFIRRHRAGVIAGTLLAAVLVLGVIGTTGGMLWAMREKSRADLAAQAESHAKRKAEDNAADALRAADEAERTAYQAQMISAANAIEDQRMDAAAALLAATAPRLRGWEHRHLTSRLDRSLPSPFPPNWQITRFDGAAASPRVAVLRSADHGPVEWVVLEGDLRTERLVAPDTEAESFKLSPDGARAVWAPQRSQSDLGRPAVLWNVETSAAVATIPIENNSPQHRLIVTWNVTGDRFVISHPDGYQMHDGRTGARLHSERAAGYVFFTGDDRWMLLQIAGRKSGFNDRQVRLLDARTLEPLGEVLHFDSPTYHISFRHSRVACALENGTLRLLEIEDGILVERATIPAGLSSFNAPPAWSPDGRLIAVGSTAVGRVRVWDAHSAALRGDFGGQQSGVAAQCFLPDGGLCACDLGGHHRVWPVRTASSEVLAAHKSYVYPAVISSDGGLLMTGGWDGLAGHSGGLKLWDARSGALVAEYGQPGEIFMSAGMTPDARFAVVSIRTEHESARRTAMIDLATGTVQTEFRPRTRDTVSVSTVVHPDGKRGISTYPSGEAYVWDLMTGNVLWETESRPKANSSDLAGAAVSPDGLLLAFADKRLGIRLVRANTYSDVCRWDAHAGGIWSLAFSPDGTRLLSASEDQTVGVWDVSTGALVARLVGHSAQVLCAAMSPDGTRIASGGRDGIVRLWDTTHFENIAQLGGHTDYIYCLVWSPDGQQLISTSGDSTVRIWETRTLAERMAAVQERADAVPGLEARIAKARAVAPDAVSAVEAVIAATVLGHRERELARQVAAHFAFKGMPAYYRASRAPTPIVIDGKVDDDAWNDAPWSEPFVDIEGDAKPKPRFETRVRMCWDDTNLYVAAKLEEPHVWATLKNRDDIVLRDNDFEVFLDPEGDTRWYGEVEVNALGTIFDLRLERPYLEGGPAHHDWSPPGMRAAAAIDGTPNDPSDIDGGWTVEIAIPHAGLADQATVPIPPRPGDVWRINFSRVEWLTDVVDGRYVKRPDTKEDNWVWSPQHVVNMHVPREWGFVEFVQHRNEETSAR
jgi:WD40 repeat protein